MRPIVRRIRHSEIDKIRMFCQSPTDVEPSPFSKHTGWLNRVLDELNVKDNSRVAFGAFYKRKNSYGSSAVYEVVGCLFLKQSSFDNTVELKNLMCASLPYLSQNFDLTSDLENVQEDIRRILIEKATRYAEIREFSKLEMEVLQDNMKRELSLLLSLEFNFISLREKYAVSTYVYILEKYIGETYQSDPFDDHKILRWLIRNIFPSEVGKITDIPLHNGDENQEVVITKAPFSKSLETPAVKRLVSDRSIDKNIKQIIKDKFAVHGEILLIKNTDEYVLNNNIGIIFGMFDENSKLRFLLSRYIPNDIENTCQTQNISIIDYKMLEALAGEKKSSLQIPFYEEDIGGFITVLEEQDARTLASKPGFIYYLVSGIGGTVSMGGNSDWILMIYCPRWKKDSDHGLIGYAKIDEIANSPFASAYGVYESEGLYSALTQEDLEYYKKNTIADEGLVILKCREITLFNKVLSIEELSDQIRKIEKIEEKKNHCLAVTDYIRFELLDNLASSVYIDDKIVEFIQIPEFHQSLLSND